MERHGADEMGWEWEGTGGRVNGSKVERVDAKASRAAAAGSVRGAESTNFVTWDWESGPVPPLRRDGPETFFCFACDVRECESDVGAEAAAAARRHATAWLATWPPRVAAPRRRPAASRNTRVDVRAGAPPRAATGEGGNPRRESGWKVSWCHHAPPCEWGRRTSCFR